MHKVCIPIITLAQKNPYRATTPNLTSLSHQYEGGSSQGSSVTSTRCDLSLCTFIHFATVFREVVRVCTFENCRSVNW